MKKYAVIFLLSSYMFLGAMEDPHLPIPVVDESERYQTQEQWFQEAVGGLQDRTLRIFSTAFKNVVDNNRRLILLRTASFYLSEPNVAQCVADLLYFLEDPAERKEIIEGARLLGYDLMALRMESPRAERRRTGKVQHRRKSSVHFKKPDEETLPEEQSSPREAPGESRLSGRRRAMSLSALNAPPRPEVAPAPLEILPEVGEDNVPRVNLRVQALARPTHAGQTPPGSVIAGILPRRQSWAGALTVDPAVVASELSQLDRPE